jgi:hypothetical protein
MLLLDTPTDYAGASIFWAYILAALSLTILILHTIIQTHKKNGSNPNIPLPLILLATSSFATLSYHMLHVLILSYRQWATLHNMPLPNAGVDLAGALLGHSQTPLYLWQWSLTSCLFRDFGMAIVETKARYLLSSAGLWSTVAVAIYMGIEGNVFFFFFFFSFSFLFLFFFFSFSFLFLFFFFSFSFSSLFLQPKLIRTE